MLASHQTFLSKTLRFVPGSALSKFGWWSFSKPWWDVPAASSSPTFYGTPHPDIWRLKYRYLRYSKSFKFLTYLSIEAHGDVGIFQFRRHLGISWDFYIWYHEVGNVQGGPLHNWRLAVKNNHLKLIAIFEIMFTTRYKVVPQFVSLVELCLYT